MRAGASGRLFGSVTSQIVAAELSRITGREIDRRTVEIAEPIRELGTFDVTVRLMPEIEAGVKVLVYAAGTDPSEMDEASGQMEEETSEDPSEET